MADRNTVVTLALKLGAVETILNWGAERPFKESSAILNEIQDQANAQIRGSDANAVATGKPETPPGDLKPAAAAAKRTAKNSN